MPGIRFPHIAEKFLAALELAGATVILQSAVDSRPLTAGVVVGGESYRMEIYLWTITHGGKGRKRPREYRIQRTAAAPFVLKAGVRTIMGGWHEDTGTWAFWDVRRHLTKAKSPSSQISLDTLEKASIAGLATETRNLHEGREIAIAVQPDFLLWYIQEYERIYDVAPEVDDAGNLVDASPEDERNFIDTASDEHAVSRRHGLVEVVRQFREARFRPLVLRAYGYRCCLTGVALRLVDAAHIVPVSDPGSTDDPRNGLALNPLLHRAYDAGLLGLLPGGRTALNERRLDGLRAQRLDGGLNLLRQSLPPEMRMPSSPEFRPPDEYFLRGLRARGWTDDDIGSSA
ncbi:MAG: HNH endonuclease [Phycisphaeraceae bacterium]|nr:HNH endonuclease [Phycisphaeraceae bacterium]